MSRPRIDGNGASARRPRRSLCRGRPSVGRRDHTSRTGRLTYAPPHSPSSSSETTCGGAVTASAGVGSFADCGARTPDGGRLDPPSDAPASPMACAVYGSVTRTMTSTRTVAAMRPVSSTPRRPGLDTVPVTAVPRS
jgi:hypothetical protein